MLPAPFPPSMDATAATAAGGPEHLPGWFGADPGRGGTGGGEGRQGGAVGAAGGGAAAEGLVGSTSLPLVYVASGRDEVSLWSADTGQCHQVFSVAPQPSANPAASSPSLPSPSNLPSALQSAPHLLPLPPFSISTTTTTGRTLSSSPCMPPGRLPQSSQSTRSMQSTQSALRVEQLKEPPIRAGGVRALLAVPGGGAVLSGGTDCCIRYWCRLRAEWVGVWGPQPRVRGERSCIRDTTCASCRARESYRKPRPPSPSKRLVFAPPVQQRASTESGGAVAGSQGQVDRGSGGGGGGGRRSMVEVAAVDAGGCHCDAVLALAVADPGQRLLLSASRDGGRQGLALAARATTRQEA
ncbi:hypothetical protein CLOP_g2807 [Closterium sp. NIES-67]|nr:hypothetical protein CLOP_g2807 [Closterium sp. NIES-67]